MRQRVNAVARFKRESLLLARHVNRRRLLKFSRVTLGDQLPGRRITLQLAGRVVKYTQSLAHLGARAWRHEVAVGGGGVRGVCILADVAIESANNDTVNRGAGV